MYSMRSLGFMLQLLFTEVSHNLCSKTTNQSYCFISQQVGLQQSRHMGTNYVSYKLQISQSTFS